MGFAAHGMHKNIIYFLINVDTYQSRGDSVGLMRNKYAISEDYLFQLVGSQWVLINDGTGSVIEEGNDVVPAEDFNEDAFVLFESDFNADDSPAYEVRGFVIESAQEYL